MTAFDDVSEDVLRELAQTRAEEESFLSIYLDLDPSHFATAPARQSEIDSLLDAAHREIEQAEHPHAELMALRAALERAREILEGIPEGELAALVSGARALALFICEPLELTRSLRLAQAVQNAVLVSDEPFIAPLLEQGARGRVLVALLDERFARLLFGAPEALREAVSFGDDVHGRNDKGGWSQSRHQLARREEVEGHLRHVARVLMDLLKVTPYDALLIACSEQLWPRIIEKLHPEVRGRLREERLALDVSDVRPEQVREAAAAIFAEERSAHEQRVLEQLREHRARDDGRAAVGLSAVLEALVERRVAVLVYDPELKQPGVRCESCGWMGLEGERCPVDGGQLERRADIVADALAAAQSESAEALALRERPELASYGRIAALLRF